ncbi:MAG: class I SAM-dependent methyltransferase [Myxococcales bacterium]|nr:class I SAM-dependent methyltransferase [Myxococcales bacterium]
MQSARCPAHPDAALEPVVRGAEDTFWGLGGSFDYGACVECGTWVLDPRPAPDEMGPWYAGYYNPPELDRRRALAQAKGPSGALALDDVRAADYLRRLKQQGVEVAPGQRLLDAGCGLGAFARAVRDRTGADVRGVDFDARCAAFAGEVFDVPVDVGELGAQGYPDGHFDLVTSWHCLEHVYDPAAELRELARVTRPGGWLTLEVPAVGPLARLFRGRWLFLQAPTHLYHFDPGALRGLIEGAGFRVAQVSRPWLPTELAGSLLLALGLRGGFARRLVFRPPGGTPWGWLALFLALMPLDLLVTGLCALAGRSGGTRVVAQRREDP